MSGPSDDLERMIRWYPADWRARYGAEMVALLEDELEGTTPTVGLRVSLALAGTRQRARSGGLPGDGASPGLRVQTGALIVLSGWAVVVLGGAGFATLSEHFMEAQAPQAQALARGAFTMAVALALCGGALVLVGAVLALPATLRFLRSGGWPAVRRRVWCAVVAAAGLVGATIGLAHWARHLTFYERNGGDVAYTVAFLAWALLVAVALGLLAAAGVAVGRRITLERSVLRAEGALAIAVSSFGTGLTVATGLWWVAMARGAPWFRVGTRPGTRPTPVTLSLVLVECCLVASSVVVVLRRRTHRPGAVRRLTSPDVAGAAGVDGATSPGLPDDGGPFAQQGDGS